MTKKSVLSAHSESRRAFLKRSGQLAMTGTALPFALNLAAMGEAAAFNSADYKALVCVFLYGGNDYANTVVTYDNDSYDKYSTIRGGGPSRTAGGIALAQADLTPTLLVPTVPLPGSRQYALHPSMTGLAGLFNSGKAAVQLNVGPLTVPLTRTQYNSSNKTLYPVPPKLFSHNDQQSTWQSSSPEGSTIGWGGNLGDLGQPSNSPSTFTCISAAGNAVYLSGDNAIQYQVNANGGSPGAVPITGVKSANIYGSTAVKNAFSSMIQQGRSHVLENEYNVVTTRAISAESTISAALLANPADTANFTSALDTNPLAVQLKLVARLIAARLALGAKRQVFFVSIGGFDLHDNLISQQPLLMQRVSDAMTAFYNATVTLGIPDQVTTFTASDFGRTLASNGDGSDHGWGSHHFVVGGAVRGKAFYGTAPSVSIGNTASADDQSHVGQGRLIPTTSVDQYAATMAKWFGVTDAEMPSVLPNIRHFGTAAARPDYPTDMGFMM